VASIDVSFISNRKYFSLSIYF